MWRIDEFEIIGPSYLRGLRLTLPMGLTCIIGPRGSGKTSLAEALRFVLTGLPSDSKSRMGLLKDNMGQATIVLKTVSKADPTESRYVVSRTYPAAAAISTADGRPLTNVELDRGTFLPFDAFSSREIEDIADESLGGRRRQLLDSLKAEPLREIELSISEKRRALDANADVLRSLAQTIKGIEEQLEELSGAPDRLAALPAMDQGEDAVRLAASTRQQGQTQSEVESLRKTWNDVAALKGRIVADREALFQIGVSVDPESSNYRSLSQAGDAVAAALQDTAAFLAQAIQRLERLQLAISESGKELRVTQEEQSVAHQRLMEAHAALGQAIQVRNRALQDVAKLELLGNELKDAKRKREEALQLRRSLKADYVSQRDRVSELREGVAAQLARDCGPSVRLRVERHADAQEYQQTLLRGLSGSGIRNQDEVVQELMGMRPEQLSQALLEGDLEEMEHALRLGKDRTKRVFDALRANTNPLELEVLATDDKVCIELNVGTEVDQIYKDASELSRGQKCTALLPLLLARRETPLLIDQPEDNLDNHFIYETVVDAIRRIKPKRQMIFITHNANIPVLAEAELVVVMDSDGRAGYVKKVGTLDECREEIVDLLEGGKEAFALRSERYGRA